MLNFHHLAGRPWAVTAAVAEMGRRLFELEGISQLRQVVKAHELDAARGGRAGARADGGVVVIPIVGLLTQRGDVVDSMETTSTAQIANQVRAAVDDQGTRALVLEIDSPGGEVYGVLEAAAVIREARKAKPVVAVANAAAASAAYWLFAQAQEGFVTPSGEVGSIGVYGAHMDVSKEMELRGRKVTYVYAGEYKVEGNPHEPLGDEARASMQSDVDRYYDLFLKDVARGRGVALDTVRSGFGKGRMLGAKAAVEAGMANLVGTLEDAVKRAGALADERRRGAGTVAQTQMDRFRRARP